MRNADLGGLPSQLGGRRLVEYVGEVVGDVGVVGKGQIGTTRATEGKLTFSEFPASSDESPKSVDAEDIAYEGLVRQQSGQRPVMPLPHGRSIPFENSANFLTMKGPLAVSSVDTP